MISFFDLPPIYDLLIPLFCFGFAISLLLTPIVGKISYRLNLVDLPGALRNIKDKTKDRRIHNNPTPLAGGTAVIIPFLILVWLTVGLDRVTTGIILGTLVIFIAGIFDNRYNLSAKKQMIFHWISAFVVVMFGLTIRSINLPIIGEVNLDWYHFEIFSNYGLSLPADFITALWIVVVINAINWVNGSDGLAEGISVISGFAIMFIAVEIGAISIAIIAAIFAGSLLGFLPYNFYPAKIFSGAGGPTYGFILAVLAILVGGKLSTAVLLLSLPLIDMMWVMFGRMRKYRVLNPLKIMHISDKTHLHHRLLNIGFNAKQVAYIEYTIVAIIGTTALFLSNIEKIGLIAAVVTFVIVIFVLINIYEVRNGKLVLDKKMPVASDPTKDETPESKYTY